MDADDLGRMLGWEFSLMTATVRIINSGLLDDLPTLKIHFSHFSGGIGRYRGRINGFQQREKWGTSKIPRHGRQPKQAFDHYLDHRLFYDCGLGGTGPVRAARRTLGAVRLARTGAPQCVFGPTIRKRSAIRRKSSTTYRRCACSIPMRTRWWMALTPRN